MKFTIVIEHDPKIVNQLLDEYKMDCRKMGLSLKRMDVIKDEKPTFVCAMRFTAPRSRYKSFDHFHHHEYDVHHYLGWD